MKKLANGGVDDSNVNTLGVPKLVRQDIDLVVLWVPVLLIFWGLIMVYSASVALPTSSRKYAEYSPYHFFLRHAMAICVAFVLAIFAFRLPTKTWEKLAPLLFAIALFLLILVLVPHIGRSVNGSRRWLPLGIMNLQPSEIMKLACALYAASYCVRKQDNIKDFSKGVAPMAFVVGMVGLLLILEPDLGAFMIVVSIVMGVIFLGGVNYKVFAALVAALVSGFVAMIIFTPYRAARLFAYLDPWQIDNAQGGAYQLTQSLIAFGRGELFGVGLGDSIQKMDYLPEAHTDFIFAVIGEEFGLLGVWTVIIAFTILIRRMFAIAREAMAFERTFQALAVQGLAIWFGVQAFINMGVNMGVLPTKGLTLPFVSYGGSAILMGCLAIAFVLRVDFENRRLMRGEKV
ncbi:putative lipid II flippase FtsW [Formosimonas limnophila]|nr:putative lipid II flippase FtsW [Formosimonas limnophila]